MRGQDLLSSLRQFQRRVAVIGSVAYLVANNPGGLLAMSRGAGDRGKIKPLNLLIRLAGGSDLGGRPGCVEVAFAASRSAGIARGHRTARGAPPVVRGEHDRDAVAAANAMPSPAFSTMWLSSTVDVRPSSPIQMPSVLLCRTTA